MYSKDSTSLNPTPKNTIRPGKDLTLLSLVVGNIVCSEQLKQTGEIFNELCNRIICASSCKNLDC